MSCTESISLTSVTVIRVNNFACSINKAKSKVWIPWLGVDNDARRTQLSFQMPVWVCNPDSQTNLVLTRMRREWVWRSKYGHNFHSCSTDSKHVLLRRIVLGVTSAQSPSRPWWVISYTNECQICSFPNKKTLRWHEHRQTDASAETAVEEAQSPCIMRCLWCQWKGLISLIPGGMVKI